MQFNFLKTTEKRKIIKNINSDQIIKKKFAIIKSERIRKII